MKEKLIIVGTSTTALQAFDFVKSYDLFEIVGFAVDEAYRNISSFCGLPVYDLERLETYFDMSKVKVFVALFWNRLNSDRRQIYERLKKKGYQFANLISPHAVIIGTLLGGNCWIDDYVVIQSMARVGENCIIGVFVLVAPSATVGPHSFLSAESIVAGNVQIGEQTFVGLNCTIFDDTTVGRKCILGANTAIKRNIPDFTVVKTVMESVDMETLDEEQIEGKLLFKKNVR